MKKNLRIVSAAAAALLAVAPVAAAAVVPANAAVESTPTTAQKAKLSSSDSALQSQALNYLKGFLTGNAKNNSFQVSVKDRNGKDHGTATLVFNGSQKFDANPTITRSADGKTAKAEVNGTYNTSDKGFAYNVTTSEGFNDGDTFTFNGQKYTFHDIHGQNHDNDATEFTVLAKNPITVNFTLEGPSVNKDVDSSVYFVRYDGHELANDATVVATQGQNNELFYNKKGNMRSKITVAELKVAIEQVLSLRNNKNASASWSKNVWDQATSDDNLISQLRHAGFTVTGSGDSASFAPSNKSFTINVKALNGATANVTFQNAYAPDTVSPVIYGNYGSIKNPDWQPVLSRGGYVRPIIVSQNDLANNSAWNAYDYLRADANSSTKAWINATYTGDKVDLTKAGVYNVTVSATNAAGKTTTHVVPVIVSDINGKVMTLVADAPVYAINNGVATQATGLKTLPTGSQVKVFGSAVTAKLNGTDTQFYRIISPKANYYVPASALKNGVTTPSTPSATNAVSKTIMHVAAFYDKTGKRLSDPVVHAYNSISVLPTTVKINGKDFYQVVENGKAVEKYVKASNIDATRRTLKHNSYVYKSNGKTYMKSKKHHEVVKSGSSVNTYGGQLKVNGSMMYRIGRNRYIKVANFR